jgi:hypothetical protein
MKVRANSTYFYDPVMMDQLDPPHGNPLRGVQLTVKNLHGCPPAGTMGMCHVHFAESGEFAGLVSINSLTKDNPLPGKTPVCAHCGSAAVLEDAYAIWSDIEQIWELHSQFDNHYCQACDGECGIEWRAQTAADRERNA